MQTYENDEKASMNVEKLYVKFKKLNPNALLYVKN